MNTKIYLVPGFFGFSSIGALNYFYRVADVLGEHLDLLGVKADIIECPTLPTGSLRSRAKTLADHVINTDGLSADNLHFIGHSTGGLDIRLLLTPGVKIADGAIEDAIGERTRSAVFVSTPHYGTPLASFFTTLPGRNTLQILAVLAVSDPGRISLLTGARLIETVAKVDDFFGRTDTFLDRISQKVLSRINYDASDPIWQFLRDVASDQGAIIHLLPETLDLFNASVTDRESVKYSSLATAAPPPPTHFTKADLLPMPGAAIASVFTILHTLTTRTHSHYPYPEPTAEAKEVLKKFPYKMGSSTNDGIVPTLSQIHGKLLDVVVSDHLDVVGQFKNSGGNNYSDWLPSGSGFNEDRFQKIWSTIAQELQSNEL